LYPLRSENHNGKLKDKKIPRKSGDLAIAYLRIEFLIAPLRTTAEIPSEKEGFFRNGATVATYKAV